MRYTLPCVEPTPGYEDPDLAYRLFVRRGFENILSGPLFPSVFVTVLAPEMLFATNILDLTRRREQLT
jgi:hypothetical protein